MSLAWRFKFRFIFFIWNFYGIVKKKNVFALPECKFVASTFPNQHFHSTLIFESRLEKYFIHTTNESLGLVACAEMFDKGRHFDSPLDGYRSERHKFNLIFVFVLLLVLLMFAKPLFLMAKNLFSLWLEVKEKIESSTSNFKCFDGFSFCSVCVERKQLKKLVKDSFRALPFEFYYGCGWQKLHEQNF